MQLFFFNILFFKYLVLPNVPEGVVSTQGLIG